MSDNDNAADQNIDEPDYTVSGGGTVYLVRPQNTDAATWLRDHVDSEAQWLGNALAVEHRYIEPLVDNLRNDGFTVEGE